ncbi:hypothetical protein GCM10010335_06590 [Streptomyces galbus]|nr:hypothetical protein GCM10010335_06590 [Streptomyces galbus]
MPMLRTADAPTRSCVTCRSACPCCVVIGMIDEYPPTGGCGGGIVFRKPPPVAGRRSPVAGRRSPVAGSR